MWWLVRDDDQLKPDQIRYREVLLEICPEIALAHHLAWQFLTLFRERQVDAFDQWLADAEKSHISALRHFAVRLRQDYDAVKNALIYEWSSGQVEGQVNRLKVIKRQMYGRANFDLLRLRVLYSAP